jgi:hypothetical protein
MFHAPSGGAVVTTWTRRIEALGKLEGHDQQRNATKKG